jgi:U3 small nucleolar RNA-associated protein 21
MSDSSRLFCGHRALGYVSNSVPLVSRYVRRRRENLIVTCVGKSFHTYGGSKLGLLSVSKIHPEDITTLAAGKNRKMLRLKTNRVAHNSYIKDVNSLSQSVIS